MSRVLSRPTLGRTPHTVAPVAPSQDPVVQQLVAAAAEQAYQRGVAEGRAQGHAEGRATVGELAAALGAAIGDVTTAVRAMRIEQADGTVDLATAVAAHVLDREPADEGRALLARVRQWLTEIDDGPLQLAVSAADADVVAAAVADRDDISIVVADGLGQGEARLVGRWARAELTRAARWDEVRRVLHEVTDGTTDA